MKLNQKILFIYPNALTPIDSGSKINAIKLSTFLRGNGFIVDVISCYYDQKNTSEIQNYFDQVIEIKNPLSKNILLKFTNKILNSFIINPFRKNYFVKIKLRREIAPYLCNYDYIFLHYLEYYSVLPSNTYYKTLVFTHDILSLRYVSLSKNLFRGLISKYIDHIECALLNKFKKALVVARYEENYLQKKLNQEKVIYIGVPFSTTLTNMDKPEFYFGFIGAAALQNIWAITYFIKTVYSSNQDKSFIIAGKISEMPEVRSLCARYPNIHLEGFIPTLKDFYKNVRFIVATIPCGSGIKVKVLEALAYGKVTLVTKKALEGIPATHLSECIQINNLSSNQISTLLKTYEDDTRYTKMAKAAQNLIQTYFSEDYLYQDLLKVLKDD